MTRSAPPRSVNRARIRNDQPLFHRPPDFCMGDRHWHHACRAGGHAVAADRPISRHRATGRQYPGELSRRFGRHRRNERHPSHRTATDRHRWPDVLLIDIHSQWSVADQRHLQQGDGPRYRAGTGPKQGAAGIEPVAQRGSAARPNSHQVADRLPDAGRSLRSHGSIDAGRHIGLSGQQFPGPDFPTGGYRRRSDLWVPICDAHMAGPL